jgi:hypothetical protein
MIAKELLDAWVKAQDGERKFHCDPDAYTMTLAERRQREHAQRSMYAGLMRTSESAGSVTDIGCGPQSLLLLDPPRPLFQRVAVDPLRFSDDDEQAYADHGISRVIAPAEQYEGPSTDEVWMYNCLQHTIDPQQVLQTVCRHATKTIRLFEWTNVPTDHLHLHLITANMIKEQLLANHFKQHFAVEGIMHDGGYPTKFYAAVWQRNTPT